MTNNCNSISSNKLDMFKSHRNVSLPHRIAISHLPIHTVEAKWVEWLSCTIGRISIENNFMIFPKISLSLIRHRTLKHGRLKLCCSILKYISTPYFTQFNLEDSSLKLLINSPLWYYIYGVCICLCNAPYPNGLRCLTRATNSSMPLLRDFVLIEIFKSELENAYQ